MTCHQYTDLDSAADWLKLVSLAARLIRSITQIEVVTRHQYGISTLVPQTLFAGKALVASGNVGCFLRLLLWIGKILLSSFWSCCTDIDRIRQIQRVTPNSGCQELCFTVAQFLFLDLLLG